MRRTDARAFLQLGLTVIGFGIVLGSLLTGTVAYLKDVADAWHADGMDVGL